MAPPPPPPRFCPKAPFFMPTLEALARPTAKDTHRYTWLPPGDWHQGRGTFGGLVMDAILTALIEAHGQPEARPLRTVTATMCGPVMALEPCEIRLHVLREGSGTDTWRAQLWQGEELRTDVVALWGKPRTDPQGEPIAGWMEMPRPEISAPWRDLDLAPVVPPMAPEFAQHFEYRITGDFPFSQAKAQRAQGWIRPKSPGTARHQPYLAALADAWWPAAYAGLTLPRPMATITFTMEFLGTLPPDLHDTPLFYRAHSPVSSQGYSVEFRELWSEAGQLLALNQQTVVIIA